MLEKCFYFLKLTYFHMTDDKPIITVMLETVLDVK
jgi:hypothetical protein